MKIDSILISLCVLAVIIAVVADQSLPSRIFAGAAAAVLSGNIVYKIVRLIRNGKQIRESD